MLGDEVRSFTICERWNSVMRKTDGSLSILVDEFINSVWEVARGCDTVRVYANKTCKVNVSRETRKFIATKRDMFKSISEPDFDVSVYKDLWIRIQTSKKKDAGDR
jgi:L-asparaginase/Glu-tRNA(Gln) amidotransferase subunit D